MVNVPLEIPQPSSGMASLPILIGPGKEFVVYYPIGTTTQDIEDFEEIWKIYKKRIAIAPTPPPAVRKGEAFWRNKDHDQPIVVTGYFGCQGGRHFVSVENSNSGVPLDEIDYGSE